MKKFSNFLIDYNSNIIDAVYKIQQNKSREVIILSKKKVLGILSEGDILRCILKGISLHSPVSKHYNKNFKFLNERNEKNALIYFSKYNLNIIPIVNKKFELKDIIILSKILNKI
jgi:predicted transcriptional regulator